MLERIKRKPAIDAVTASPAALLFLIGAGISAAQSNDAALIAKAKGIHERVLKLDTHNDIDPANFTPDCNYTMRLTTQVNHSEDGRRRHGCLVHDRLCRPGSADAGRV